MSDTLTVAQIKKLKVADLKAELSARGLALKGKKDELAKRLIDFIENDGDSEAEEDGVEEVGEMDESAVDTTMEDSQSSLEQEEAPEVAEEVLEEAVEEPAPEETAVEEEPVPVEEPVEEPAPVAEEVESPKKRRRSRKSETEPVAEEPEEPVVEPVEEEPAPAVEEVAESPKKKSPRKRGRKKSEALVEDEPVQEEIAVVEEQEEPVEDSPKKRSKRPRRSDPVETPSKRSRSAKEATPEKEAEDAPETSEKGDEWVLLEHPTDEEKVEMKEQEKTVEEANKAKVDDAKKVADTEEKKEPEKKEPEKLKPAEEPAVDHDEAFVEVEAEEGDDCADCAIEDGKVGLDRYHCDMNLVVSPDGCTARSLVKNGFSYMWAGGQANMGVKHGKICFEVRVLGPQEVSLPEDEELTHALRVGWSADPTNLQLGEASLSYGYESTGKVCASSSFFAYGQDFAEGDVVGAYIDLESEPKALKFTKNGEDLGVAMSLSVKLEDKTLFPHIFIKNMSVELNFGGREEPWYAPLEGFSLIQDAGDDELIGQTCQAPATKEDCEVIMMIGLPCAGKSAWVERHLEKNPAKKYQVVSLKRILERTRIEGKDHRQTDDFMANIVKVMSKLFSMCPNIKRNFIYDQTNIYKNTQKRKMEGFTGFQRKGVIVIPTHDNLRKRTSDATRERKDEGVPFGDLCDMKCGFHCPEAGDLFDELKFTELDERNAKKTVGDYHSDGTRGRRAREEYYPSKRRYDDRRDNRGGGDYKKDGWKNSGTGYGTGNYGNRYQNQQQSSYGKSAGGGGNYRGGNYSSGGSNYPARSYSSGGSGGGQGQDNRQRGGGYSQGDNRDNRQRGADIYRQAQASYAQSTYQPKPSYGGGYGSSQSSSQSYSGYGTNYSGYGTNYANYGGNKSSSYGSSQSSAGGTNYANYGKSSSYGSQSGGGSSYGGSSYGSYNQNQHSNQSSQSSFGQSRSGSSWSQGGHGGYSSQQQGGYSSSSTPHSSYGGSSNNSRGSNYSTNYSGSNNSSSNYRGGYKY